MRENPADTGLVVFLKAPANAKRRVAEAIGPLADEVAEHLWRCAREDVAAWRGPTWYSPADDADASWLERELDSAEQVCIQVGRNLGERLNHVDRELRTTGVEKLVFIGTDCPELDVAYLQQAAECLDSHDVVLGPSQDGGVVLMGSRLHWPDLGALRWSTDSVYSELRSLVESAGSSVIDLERHSDVDTVEDLLATSVKLRKDRRPARRALTDWIAAHRNELSR